MHGRFIWHELMTTDTEQAAAFYAHVFGLEARDSGMPGMNYNLFHLPGSETYVSGMMAITAEDKAAGMPSNWTGYVAVDDCDKTAAEFAAHGGAILKAPDDIPEVGRFAVVADPSGAVICVMTPTPSGAMPDPIPDGTPGTVGWAELMNGEAESAYSFYAARFGWSREMAMDMGPMGTYQCFGVDGQAIGGMMRSPEGTPGSFWGYYFYVPAMDAAIGRAREKGGSLVNGPMEVPGGQWAVQMIDPTGAYFCMLAPVR